MTKLIKRFRNALILVATICMVACQSCKQGCTDPKAYNYMKGAKQDDASCLYCDSSVYYSVNSNTYTYYDYVSGSPHYGESVLNIYVNENELFYSGNGCKVLGLGTNNNCTRYSFKAQLYNETRSTMVFTGTFITTTNTQNATYTFSSVSIPPYGNITVNVGSVCDNGFYFNSSMQNYSFQYY